MSGGQFVGRERELGRLRQGLNDALEGRARLWLLAGDAGIGKTSLAATLADEARGHGATVLWGRCWEGEGAPTFWPWVQVIRGYVLDREPSAVREVMGQGAGVVAQIASEVRERLGDLPPVAHLDSVPARFRLFDSVATFLGSAARREPLVLVFDDLHWADQDSLTLLHFVAREVRSSRLLLLGTYRQVEAGARHSLERLLDAVAREGQRLELRGLSEDEIGTLIERIRGAKPSSGLVRSVSRLTEGNPFFAGELLNVMDEEKSEGTVEIPISVRQTLERRLERISSASLAVLATAAVVGREFRVEVLREVSRRLGTPSEESLLGCLDEAAAERLIVAVTANRDRYAFSHTLIRETLYEELGSAERAGLHQRVGESLVALSGAGRESDSAELAHHFFTAGDVEPAVEYAMRAGARAAALLAFEDAAAHYAIALEALRRRRSGLPQSAEDGERRSRLLLALADNLMRAGERPRAKQTYLELADLARAADQPRLLGRAALGFSGLGDATPSLDPQVVGLLEEALGALRDDTSALRIRVQSRLSEVLYFSPAHERRAALSEEAVVLAERSEDTAILGYALNARHFALWRPQGLADRIVVADRIVDLANRAGDRELALAGRMWRIIDLLELGDVAAVDAEIEAFGALAAVLRQAFNLWQLTSMRAMRALMDGRLEEGERLVQEASTLGQQARSPNVAFRYGVQLTLLRRLQGRFHELEGLIKASAERYPGIAAFRVALALLLAETGRLDEARTVFDSLAANDFTAIPEDATWIGAMCHLSETCAVLGDADRAAALHARLLPYAGRNVVISFAHGCEGAVSRSLGLLAATMKDWTSAVRHFEDALAMNARMGARPFLAHTQRAYASVLLERGDPRDAQLARELWSSAGATYAQLGMIAHSEQVARRSAPDGGQSPVGSWQIEGRHPAASELVLPTADCPLPTEGNVFRRQGDYWSLGYDGKVVQLRDLKGLHYLIELLRHPGQDIHVMDLVLAVERPGDRDSVRSSASAVPAADASARSAYRHRVAELRDEVDEAERFNDTARAAKARHELELVTAELGKAYGVGASRWTNEPAERARKAVANRIRLVLQRLRRVHPALARHLALTLRIGTFCSYRPEELPSWDLG